MWCSSRPTSKCLWRRRYWTRAEISAARREVATLDRRVDTSSSNSSSLPGRALLDLRCLFFFFFFFFLPGRALNLLLCRLRSISEVMLKLETAVAALMVVETLARDPTEEAFEAVDHRLVTLPPPAREKALVSSPPPPMAISPLTLAARLPRTASAYLLEASSNSLAAQAISSASMTACSSAASSQARAALSGWGRSAATRRASFQRRPRRRRSRAAEGSSA
mmetsp:Transcript_40970/g.96187  ORF Transcript_40970/g.96187 Transcript_40970/m.96187 type:complete len:222 (-) Transcript_40970:987-1652(-)